MRTKIYFFVLLLILTSGCLDLKSLTDSSTVLHLNLAITENDSKPTIDFENTTRFSESIPIMKQHSYDDIVSLPYVSCDVFYKQNKISYFTSKPYEGAGEYEFTIIFRDNKPIPNSSDETITVLVTIVGSDGKYLVKEYIFVRWP